MSDTGFADGRFQLNGAHRIECDVKLHGEPANMRAWTVVIEGNEIHIAAWDDSKSEYRGVVIIRKAGNALEVRKGASRDVHT